MGCICGKNVKDHKLVYNRRGNGMFSIHKFVGCKTCGSAIDDVEVVYCKYDPAKEHMLKQLMDEQAARIRSLYAKDKVVDKEEHVCHPEDL